MKMCILFLILVIGLTGCQKSSQDNSMDDYSISMRDDNPGTQLTKTCSCTCVSYETDVNDQPLREEYWNWTMLHAGICPKDGQKCGWVEDHFYGDLAFCSEWINPPKAQLYREVGRH